MNGVTCDGAGSGMLQDVCVAIVSSRPRAAEAIASSRSAQKARVLCWMVLPVLQVSMDWMQKVDVLEYWPGVSVASASAKFELPAVMRVRFYVQRPPKRASTMISRRNIFIRDQYMCQCALLPRCLH